jgi:pyridoxamine 5'-phosphate oxidase
LADNPKATWFFLERAERQAHNGIGRKTSEKENDDYFYSRPIESQVGAVSPQTGDYKPGMARNQFNNAEKYFISITGQRPPHWGGYLVKPVVVEFWQGRQALARQAAIQFGR